MNILKYHNLNTIFIVNYNIISKSREKLIVVATMKKIKLNSQKNRENNNYIAIPGSKSYTNRALIIATLCDGISILKNPLYSNDTIYMIQALRQLGVDIERYPNKLIIKGCGSNFKVSNNKLFCGEAGTTSRFLTALSSLIKEDVYIDGKGIILERPIGDLINALRQLGVDVDYKDKTGSLPLKINGSNLSGNKIKIKGDVSSQYLTALLMISPLLQNSLEIEVIGEQVSKSYIDITLDIMKRFGIKVINDNYKYYKTQQRQQYKAQDYVIEGDWSSASYFLCMGALNANKQLTIKNLNTDSVQGDAVLVDIIRQTGVKVELSGNRIIIYGQKTLKSIKEINMSQMPDSAMSVAVLLSFADGISKITGLSTLKFKESNRLQAIQDVLGRLNIKSDIDDDSIVIYGGNHHVVKDEIETYKDHRIAMSATIASVRLNGIVIKNPDVVNKSFSNFWGLVEKMGIEINEV